MESPTPTTIRKDGIVIVTGVKGALKTAMIPIDAITEDVIIRFGKITPENLLKRTSGNKQIRSMSMK